MADNVQVASVADNNQPQNVEPAADQAPRGGFFGVLKTLIIRVVFIYMISSFFRRSSTPTTGPESEGTKQYSQNLYPKDFRMDLYMYLTEDEMFNDFDNEAALVWKKTGLVYGDWTSGTNRDGSFEKFIEFDTPTNVQNNGSLYMHVYFVKEGKSPNPKDKGNYLKKYTVYNSKRLNKYKKRKFQNTVNLLTGETDVHPDLVLKENMSSYEILSHWHPNLTINIMDDHTPWAKGSLPAPLDDYVEFVPGGDFYYPVIYFNDYWNLNTDYQPVNDTVKKLNLTVTYTPISLLRWQMYAAQNMRSKWYSMLGADFMEDSDNDQDSLKTAIIETNPYLLAMTIIVSIVHSVFEFLAFKNDIQFWRNRKSLEGLSVRSVFFNVLQSVIVVLYVQDNETNTMVRISVFIGLIIEIWKIQKVVTIKLDRENPIFGFIPKPTFEDKSTYTESQTKKYDMMAFKYLSWGLFPLLGGYAVYSLVYLEHRGWYSWVLNMLYGFLLTFGFIMMTPQLFINYKLKSVAHLPWRMMTYKALNTFIDDIFAFVIKMPILYRIGCFRDDIVFFIFLYQRYIYRIDPKRVNEFGTSQDMLDQNGDVIPSEPIADSSPVQREITESSQSKENKAEEVGSNSDVHSPKSAEEKKND